jgi:cobalt/nickel transport protein
MRSWSRYLATAIVIGILIMAIAGSIIFAKSHEEGPWIDTTDVVSEQSASALGRQAVEPLINTDQGNMLVFFFTLAGVVGGSIVGYYWRMLMTDRDKMANSGFNKMFFIGFTLALVLLAFAGYEAFSTNPFIDPDLGDVKLFIFILSGSIIGFLFGFNWRQLRITKEKTC